MKTIIIKRRCPFCGTENEVEVIEEDLQKYKYGDLIQDAFPYLRPDDREILKTGICPKCWDRILGGE